MKTRRLSVTPVVLSLFVAILSGLAWWAGTPARAAFAPTIALIPVSGIVTGQPESVKFSGQAQVSSELVLDTSRFHVAPAVILIIDLSGVSGTGSSTGAKYTAGGDGTPVFRQLARADTVEITFTLMVVPQVNGKVISTVSALASCLNTGGPSPPAAYFAPGADPVPDTPERSMISMTDGGCGGRVLLVSSTSSLETRAWPENLTLSGCPLTMPETGMRATVGAKAARAGVPAHQSSPDKTTAKNGSTTAPTDNRRIFMIRSFSIRSLCRIKTSAPSELGTAHPAAWGSASAAA